MAVELDVDSGFDPGSRSGCLFSARLGKKPWPSTPPAAQAESYAGLPYGCLWRGFAGGCGQGRLPQPGPVDGGRLPPRVKEVCEPSLASLSALLVESRRPEKVAWGRMRLTSGLWMVLWLMERGSSSCQVYLVYTSTRWVRTQLVMLT